MPGKSVFHEGIAIERDIISTARYTHATDEAKRRAVKKLVAPSALHAGETPAVPVNALPVSVDANGNRSEPFGNGLAPEMKTARSASP